MSVRNVNMNKYIYYCSYDGDIAEKVLNTYVPKSDYNSSPNMQVANSVFQYLCQFGMYHE